MIVTRSHHIPIAAKMTRIVRGGRGDYMEIDPADILRDNIEVPRSQTWRLSTYWKDKVFYYWYVPIGEPNCKLYFQRKTVDYADYKLNMWYVSPTLVEEVPDDDREPITHDSE